MVTANSINASYIFGEDSHASGYRSEVIGFDVVPWTKKDGTRVINKDGVPSFILRMYYRSGGKDKQFIAHRDYVGVPEPGKTIFPFSQAGQLILAFQTLGVGLTVTVDDQGDHNDNIAALLNANYAGLRVRLDKFENYQPSKNGKEWGSPIPQITLPTEVLFTGEGDQRVPVRVPADEFDRLVEEVANYVNRGNKND
jgi:hypothetical protein